MSSFAKKIIVSIFRPCVAQIEKLRTPLVRAWSHAQLAASISSRLDPSVVVQGQVEVQGSGAVTFGKDLYLYPAVYLETQGEGQITVGDNVVLSRGVHLVSHAAIYIGDGAGIGEYTSVRDANHIRHDGKSVRESGHRGSPIHIGRNAWIGRGVTILPGVTIGDDAVVGANAVVTCDVLPGHTVGGVPARPLRKGSPQ